MALTLLENNEIRLERKNTIGLSVHREIHFKKVYLWPDKTVKKRFETDYEVQVYIKIMIVF